jgi:hypothetical protein
VKCERRGLPIGYFELNSLQMPHKRNLCKKIKVLLYARYLFNILVLTFLTWGVIVSDQDTRLRMPNKWPIFKEGQVATKKDNAAACLCFLNFLAFLWPAADRAVSILPWVVSRGRSYVFFWAGSIIQKNVRKGDPTPAYSPSPVSNRRSHKALVEVHWARRVQAPMPQISWSKLIGKLHY